mgnify:CR=1 FL=1
MIIKMITEYKKQFLDLLLLGDEQEKMIDRYREDGDLFALFDDDLKTVCVVTSIDSETCELKNIATYGHSRGKGYAKKMINYVSDYYRNKYNYMMVGTGDTPGMMSFYGSCGFVKSHLKKDFFIENYDLPMFEDGIQLVDMVYLKKVLNSKN